MPLSTPIQILKRFVASKFVYISFVVIFLLISVLLINNTSAKPVFARGISNSEYVQELKDKFGKISGTTSVTEIFLMENQPNLLDVKSVEDILVKKAENSKVNVTSYIDTGFSRKADAQASLSDRVSDVKVYFYVKNDSNTKQRLTINTGIKKDVLKHIRLEGATGYRWEDDELVIAYVPLPPQGSTVITLTAIPLISHNPVNIVVSPTVLNKKGEIVSKGSVESKSVQLDSQVDIRRNNASKKAESL